MQYIWYVNKTSPLCIFGKSDHTFKGYYKKYPLDDNDFIELPDFLKKVNGGDKSVFESTFSFNDVGNYLIKIVNEKNNEVQYGNIEVKEDVSSKILDEIKLSKQLNSLKLKELKDILESDKEGLLKIINDISNLPDGTRLDMLLDKIELLNVKVSNLKSNTYAFINRG